MAFPLTNSSLLRNDNKDQESSRSATLKSKPLKRPRKRCPGQPGTNVHSAAAGISVHNALLNMEPPPRDAQNGSRHLPWLRLTEWEIMNVRKKMKKNALWDPSEEIVRRELETLGRGPREYARARAEYLDNGKHFVDEDDIGKKDWSQRLGPCIQDFEASTDEETVGEAKKRKREAFDESEGRSHTPTEADSDMHKSTCEKFQSRRESARSKDKPHIDRSMREERQEIVPAWKERLSTSLRDRPNLARGDLFAFIQQFLIINEGEDGISARECLDQAEEWLILTNPNQSLNDVTPSRTGTLASKYPLSERLLYDQKHEPSDVPSSDVQAEMTGQRELASNANDPIPTRNDKPSLMTAAHALSEEIGSSGMVNNRSSPLIEGQTHEGHETNASKSRPLRDEMSHHRISITGSEKKARHSEVIDLDEYPSSVSDESSIQASPAIQASSQENLRLPDPSTGSSDVEYRGELSDEVVLGTDGQTPTTSANLAPPIDSQPDHPQLVQPQSDSVQSSEPELTNPPADASPSQNALSSSTISSQTSPQHSSEPSITTITTTASAATTISTSTTATNKPPSEFRKHFSLQIPKPRPPPHLFQIRRGRRRHRHRHQGQESRGVGDNKSEQQSNNRDDGETPRRRVERDGFKHARLADFVDRGEFS